MPDPPRFYSMFSFNQILHSIHSFFASLVSRLRRQRMRNKSSKPRMSTNMKRNENLGSNDRKADGRDCGRAAGIRAEENLTTSRPGSK